MKSIEQQSLANILQGELNNSPLVIKPGIPNDLLTELFEWKQDKDNNISIEALKNLEDILKNYF